jgi:hypothetical protein
MFSDMRGCGLIIALAIALFALLAAAVLSGYEGVGWDDGMRQPAAVVRVTSLR